jgi:hypothetical protein
MIALREAWVASRAARALASVGSGRERLSMAVKLPACTVVPQSHGLLQSCFPVERISNRLFAVRRTGGFWASPECEVDDGVSDLR